MKHLILILSLMFSVVAGADITPVFQLKYSSKPKVQNTVTGWDALFPGTSQAVSYTATAGISSALQPNSSVVQLDCTTNCFVAFGGVTSSSANGSTANACLTSVSSTTGIVVGQTVFDVTNPSKISAGTTILGLGTGPCSSGQVQMSANAANTISNDMLLFGGTNAAAVANTTMYLPAGTPKSIGVIGGTLITVIESSTSGSLYVTEGL